MAIGQLYYHYCSVSTFKKIINSKVLWLTDLTKSKDKQKVTRTFETLWSAVKIRIRKSDLDKKVVDSIIEMIDKQFSLVEIHAYKTFGICFCKYSDILQQWLEYCDRTKGIVLGFNLTWFKGLKKQMPCYLIKIM